MTRQNVNFVDHKWIKALWEISRICGSEKQYF